MRTPQEAQLRTVGKEPLWFCERDWVHPQPRGRCLGVDPDGDGLSLDQIANKLVREGVYSVLLEGGATIHRAFLEKGWVDRLEVFIAPKLIGAGKKPCRCLLSRYRKWSGLICSLFTTMMQMFTFDTSPQIGIHMFSGIIEQLGTVQRINALGKEHVCGFILLWLLLRLEMLV